VGEVPKRKPPLYGAILELQGGGREDVLEGREGKRTAQKGEQDRKAAHYLVYGKNHWGKISSDMEILGEKGLSLPGKAQTRNSFLKGSGATSRVPPRGARRAEGGIAHERENPTAWSVVWKELT